MVPATRPDCKLRWNIERERVQKNTGERGLDKLNFAAERITNMKFVFS